MIRKEELRIGNLVYCHETFTPQIHQITFADMGNLLEDPTFFSPIPLTEKLMPKFGFVDITEGYRATGQAEPVFRIQSPVRGQDITLYQKWDSVNSGEAGYFLGHYEYVMEYLHQLQNMYFSLTGQELTINL